MLTVKTKEMVERLCASLDKRSLEEVMRVVRSYYDAKVRKELETWRRGQKVEVKISATDRVRGIIISVNQRSLTIDLGRRKIRANPSLVRLV